MTRTAKALASWLGAAWHATLDLRPDLDQIEALTAEREALWARIEKVSFLTLNEKRAAVGYAPLEDPPPSATDVERSSVGRKYRADQARAPAGTSDGGQWVDEGGGSGGGASSSTRTLSDANSDGADFWKPGAQIAQARSRRSTPSGPILARFPETTGVQEVRWVISNAYAQHAIARAQAAIPGYRPRDSLTSTIEGEIARNEANERDAERAIAEAAGRQSTRPSSGSSPRSTNEVCMAGETVIGQRNNGSGFDTTTVNGSQFDNMLIELTRGAIEIPPSRPNYNGVWYRRVDGTIIGVRRSKKSGITIDIIDSQGNPKLMGLRIHAND